MHFFEQYVFITTSKKLLIKQCTFGKDFVKQLFKNSIGENNFKSFA